MFQTEKLVNCTLDYVTEDNFYLLAELYDIPLPKIMLREDLISFFIRNIKDYGNVLTRQYNTVLNITIDNFSNFTNGEIIKFLNTKNIYERSELYDYMLEIYYSTPNDFFLKIGEFNIECENIKLFVRIRIKNKNIFMSVYLPSKYPPTEIGKSEIIKKEGLFSGKLSIISNEDKEWAKIWNSAKEELGVYSEDFAFILQRFYIIPKVHGISLTLDELNMIKGLGKKILCIVMKNIMNYFNILNSEKLILLIASGTIPVDDSRIQKYIESGMREFKAKFLVMAENNEKLVDYYKRELGFVQLSPLHVEVFMAASTLEFTKHCNIQR